MGKNKRPNIHVALPLFMVIKQMMTSILELQKFVINKQCVVLVMMFFLMMGKGHTKYVEL
jgi:hypothetical protein